MKSFRTIQRIASRPKSSCISARSRSNPPGETTCTPFNHPNRKRRQEEIGAVQNHQLHARRLTNPCLSDDTAKAGTRQERKAAGRLHSGRSGSCFPKSGTRRRAIDPFAFKRTIHTCCHLQREEPGRAAQKATRDVPFEPIHSNETWQESLERQLKAKEAEIAGLVGPEAILSSIESFDSTTPDPDVMYKPATHLQDEEPSVRFTPTPLDSSEQTDCASTERSEVADSENVSRTLNAMSTLLDDPNSLHGDIFAWYETLPGNRITAFPVRMRFRLVERFSTISKNRWTKSHTVQYIRIFNDMVESKMQVGLAMWATAMRFIGLAKGAGDAVRLWEKMESQTNLRANCYMFNLLFDVAIKTKEWDIAKMIDLERRRRGIPADRVTRMSRIFYHGMLGDGKGVRHAYNEYVTSGEIIDTAVLTNVMTALIDAGELKAAETTFERMKQLHAKRKGAIVSPSLWRDSRQLRILMTQAGHDYRQRVDDRKTFQDAAPLAPDWRTYRVFILHHVSETADYDQVQELLLEMRVSGIFIPSNLYRVLFSGFVRHGGIQVNAWNEKNLELLWQHFVKDATRDPGQMALDDETFFFTTVVDAFLFCAGHRRANKVWRQALRSWRIDPHVSRMIENYLKQHRPVP